MSIDHIRLCWSNNQVKEAIYLGFLDFINFYLTLPWRMEWDSNPRYATNVRRFSRPVPSTARPPVLAGLLVARIAPSRQSPWVGDKPPGTGTQHPRQPPARTSGSVSVVGAEGNIMEQPRAASPRANFSVMRWVTGCAARPGGWSGRCPPPQSRHPRR